MSYVWPLPPPPPEEDSDNSALGWVVLIFLVFGVFILAFWLLKKIAVLAVRYPAFGLPLLLALGVGAAVFVIQQASAPKGVAAQNNFALIAPATTAPAGATKGAGPQTTGPKLGLMDLDGYCAKHGGGSSRHGPDVASWACQGGVGVRSIDMNDVCVSQYGPDAAATYNAFSDPFSWYCFRKLAATRIPPASTPAPASESNSNDEAEVVVVANTGGIGVYLRRTPTMADRLTAWPDGTRLEVVGSDATGDGQEWKHVKDPKGQVGWVPSLYVVPAEPA